MRRCALEAIASKRLVIISVHENLKGIIKPNIIERCINENFTLRNSANYTSEMICEELIKLDKLSLANLVDANYNYVYDKLDVNKNAIIIPKTYTSQFNLWGIIPHSRREANICKMFEGLLWGSLLLKNLKKTNKFISFKL